MLLEAHVLMGTTAHILIVEDEIELAEMVGEFLSEDFQVHIVNSVPAALEMIQDNGESFDLIICDLIIPQRSGMDLYRELRALNNGLHEKMIFMTGALAASEAHDFLEKVPNQQIMKPFAMSALKDLVILSLEDKD